MANQTVERTEETISGIVRSWLDEKIRLDAIIAERTAQLTEAKEQLEATIERHDKQESETIRRHAEEISNLADDRDRYLKRATQLETDLRSIVAILNDALSAKPAIPWKLDKDDGEPSPKFLHPKTYDESGKPT